MSRSILLLPFLLTACPAPDGKVDDTGSDTGTAACEISIESTIPSSGALDADYRASIEFKLSDADATATVTSTIAGTTTLVDDGETIIFTPNAPLEPSTAYTVTLNYCRGASDLTFTTSADGTPLTDVNILLGRTYALNLGEARIVEPAGVGSILGTYLTQDILVGVQTVDATEIQMIGAIGVEGSSPPEQDYCTSSIPFPVANFSAQPYFQIGPQTTTLAVAGLEIVIGDLEITGTFASDGSYFTGGTLGGTIDTRPLVPLLDEEGEPGSICDLAASFGAVCGACPEDGEPYCLTLVADQIEALQVEGESLVVVANGDCPDCETTPPAVDAVCPE
ncbi:MAG: Ig-like domain-containing protein [Pseudomonadota bacterium]|nr:Ig-like domain-containing protein [Pseudomonadota bacterium]